MHRCLQIIDIIHAICEHLDDSRSTLVQLSQTCRVLERPTTEIIWRTLDKGIDPLLDAIGGGLWEWEVTETDTGEKNRRLKRAITLQDRAALRRLGRRVKRLSIHGEHMIPSSFECLAALYASTNPNEEAYFPLLDELCVWQTQTMGIRDLSSLRIFAGPWLRILRMSLHRVTPQDLAFLSGFQGHCLNIQVLQLHFPHLAHLVASSAGALFECWPRLHTLFVQTVPFEAIEALSYLPRLTNLTATLFTSSSSPSSFNAQGGGGFPALSNLALYTANGLEFCIPVVQLLHDCPIERLRIEAGNYSPHAESFERLIRLLPRRLKHSSLRELSILEPRFALRAEQRTARIQNDPTFLSVLVVFTRLRELTSPIPCYTLSLMTLTALASGLQTLERLNLIAAGRPTITLQDLIPITRRLPYLNSLTISLDAASVQCTNQRPGSGYGHARLRRLRLGSSPIVDANSVADFLSDIFPNLKYIDVETQESPGHQEMWRVAIHQYFQFARVRAQERNAIFAAGHSQSLGA